jgi:hypothetical protein
LVRNVDAGRAKPLLDQRGEPHPGRACVRCGEAPSDVNQRGGRLVRVGVEEGHDLGQRFARVGQGADLHQPQQVS